MFRFRSIEKEESRVLYSHMKRDFPAAERPPFFVVKRLIAKQVYDAVFLMEEGLPVGYAVTVAPEGLAYALVVFLAILPGMRGQGYGGKLMEMLAQRFPGRILVLEVEDPAFAPNPEEKLIRQRRVRFYEQEGFRVISTARVKIFGVDMQLMVNTCEEVGSARRMMHSLYAPTFSSARWLRHIDVADAEERG